MCETWKKLLWYTTPRNNTKSESINEIDEDDLLDEEPEIRELMNNLIANGCDLKIPLSKTKELSSEIKQSENHLTSATEHRRLKQYKQWYTESQRPFTPRFFNICKPDFGTELHSSQLCDTYKSITSKEEVKGDKKEKDYDDDDDGDSVSSNDPTTEISEVYDQQNQADQVWHDFIYDTNYKQTKTKFRNQQLGSTNSLNSLQSGTLSSEQRCPTPSSSIMKSQSINKLTKFDINEQSLPDQFSIINKNFNRSSIINQSDLNISNKKCVQFLKSENTLKKNENQWINSINDIHKLSKETLSELVHQIEVEMDKETLKESELKLTTRGQITSKPIEKRPVKSHVNEVPKEFSSHKFMNLVNNIRKQLSIVTDENAIKLQDRLEFMKQIKPEICLAKYNNIPVNSYTHVAMQSMRRMALYDKATGELSKKSRQKNAVTYPKIKELITHNMED
ncbi:hypothetical protein Smp_125610 [Schistosoma mansoni]|uniref:hypothetical protein n=1 Tax=Schistosoma mansoni TaxID=6183 RepID=UPI00022C8579|nr:hypothetical protein Smp_125610 [Schistosoma mansoni]|eukprot:XP_018646525.1 hypothetical protein Smp_125610 [Schistosoma mansoni]